MDQSPLPTTPPISWRAEYDAATQSAAMFDRIRAVLELRGRDRATFLQGMVTNDVLALQPGQSCRAAMLDVTGHIQTDMRIHARPDSLLIETDPRIASRLAEMLDNYLIMEKVAIEDVSGDWAIISVIGPRAPEIADVFAAPHTGTRLPGYDLWLPADAAPDMRRKLADAGVIPIGEMAAEALRIETGTAAWGSELDETVLLPEADIPDIISYTKGCYIGQEIIARLHARGHTNRALRGVLFNKGVSVPTAGDVLLPADDPEREIGRITSATLSPGFDDRPLALAYVRKEYAGEGARVVVRESGAIGTVKERPFLS